MIALAAAACLIPLSAAAQIGSGATLPSGDCNTGGGSLFYLTSGDAGLYVCLNNVWTKELSPGGGGGLPAGMITLILSGTCPAGFEEATELNGRTVIGTLAANGDVGTTGGSDSITSVLNHTHAVTITDPGHTHVENTNSATTGGLRGSTPDTSTNTSVASGYSTASAQTGITADTNDPAGGVASIDNRSAFVRAIFCRKT